jgi:oligopeptide transport system substrate-binding protein
MAKLILPFLLLIAAVGASILTDRPQPRADFTFINRGDLSTLDPQRMSWMQDLRIGRLLFEGLIRNDVFSREFKVIPAAAESWEISPDGLTYTFHLRAGARWSNGEPVRAADFKFAWRRALLPELAKDYAAQFQLIRGGKPFFDWRQKQLDEFPSANQGRSNADRLAAAQELWRRTETRFDETVGLECPDERTFIVRLEHRVPYFLELCALAVFYPVYPPLVKQYESLDPDSGRLNFLTDWTKPPHLISNGPFVLTTWRFKREMRMEKNQAYWNKAALNIDTIAVPAIEDPNAAVLAFTSGGVDWVSDIDAPYRGDIVAAKLQFYKENQPLYDSLLAQGLDPIEIDRRLPPDPRKNFHAFPAFGTYFYNFNCLPRLPDGRDNPFAGAKVRKAFAMAVDKVRLTRDVRRLGERVADVLIPPGSIAGYHSPKGVSYDPEAARRLLAEAGYPGGRGFVTVSIIFNKDSGHDLIAQAIAKDWQENLGVSVSLDQKEIKVFRNDLKEHSFMVSRAGWFPDYPDPLTFLDINKTGDGNNDRGYSSPAYDALLNAAGEEADPQKRLDILSQAERMLVEDEFPLIPLYQYVNLVAFDPDRISGISSHPRQEQALFLIDILGDGKGTDKPRAMPPLGGASSKQ